MYIGPFLFSTIFFFSHFTLVHRHLKSENAQPLIDALS